MVAVAVFMGECPGGYYDSGIFDCKDVLFPSDPVSRSTYPQMVDVVGHFEYESSAPLVIHANWGDMTQWTGAFPSFNWWNTSMDPLPSWFGLAIETVDGEIIYLEESDYSLLINKSGAHTWDQFVVRVSGSYPGGLIVVAKPGYCGCYPDTDNWDTEWWRTYATQEGNLSGIDDCCRGDIVALYGDDSLGTDDLGTWIEYSELGYSMGEYAQFLNGIYYCKFV